MVLVENVVRRLGEPEGQHKTARQLTAEAAHEVMRPIAFGVGIIIIVYLPILTLGGIEGKMFKPMAWTVVFALVGSLLLSLTLIPVLASLFLVLDFDQIEQGIRNGAPQQFAWLAGFGLVVTLVWLYIEILRLLSYFQSD